MIYVLENNILDINKINYFRNYYFEVKSNIKFIMFALKFGILILLGYKSFIDIEKIIISNKIRINLINKSYIHKFKNDKNIDNFCILFDL